MLFSRNVLFVFLSLLLSSFTLVGWSGDDGSCDISDFLCPVPEDLFFHRCSQGLGTGTMTDPVNGVPCSVNTYPNGYNHNDTECRTSGNLCGVIRCPSLCQDQSSASCQCLAQWRTCSVQLAGGANQSVVPPGCIHSCAEAGMASPSQAQCYLNPATASPHRLSSLDWGLIIGGIALAVIVAISCGAGFGWYYYLRHRHYQPLPSGTDIAPPTM